MNKKFLLIFAVITSASIYFSSMVFAEDISKLYEDSFALETKGDYTGALNKVLQIIRADAKDYTAYLRAGWLCYMTGDNTTSISNYKRAASLAQEAVEPLLGMSLAMMAAKQWSEAEKTLSTILQRDESSYLANSRLAYVYFCQGKYSQAKEKYEVVLRFYPSDLDMKLGVGIS